MKIVDFPERTVIYAKNQPEYRQLPAYQTFNQPLQPQLLMTEKPDMPPAPVSNVRNHETFDD